MIHLRVIQTIITKWPKNPLVDDLIFLAYKPRMMDNFKFAGNSPAEIVQYSNYDENKLLTCPLCKWQGKGKGASYNSDSHYCLKISCSVCDKILIVAEYKYMSKEMPLEEVLESLRQPAEDPEESDQEEVIVSFINTKKKNDIIKTNNKTRKRRKRAKKIFKLQTKNSIYMETMIFQ